MAESDEDKAQHEMEETLTLLCSRVRVLQQMADKARLFTAYISALQDIEVVNSYADELEVEARQLKRQALSLSKELDLAIPFSKK